MDEAQADDQDDALIEAHLLFLRGRGPEPDLAVLPTDRREAITGQFEIVKALADRDPELPSLERDPVARRLGLVAAGSDYSYSCPECQWRTKDVRYEEHACPGDLECGWNPVQASTDCDFDKDCPVHGEGGAP